MTIVARRDLPIEAVLLNSAAAARWFTVRGIRCAPITLRKWRWYGGGPAYRTLNSRAYYTEGDLIQYVEERLSGVRSDRPQLGRLLKTLEPGDTVIVIALDRLARSTRDLLNVVDAITKAGAGFKSLADQWCDTTTPHGKLMLTVLGGLAEFERSLIMKRTQAGISRAKELGVTFGRPTKLNARQRRMIAERYAKGETMTALASEFGVGEATVWRALRGEPDPLQRQTARGFDIAQPIYRAEALGCAPDLCRQRCGELGELIKEGQESGEIERPGGDRKSMSTAVTLIDTPRKLTDFGITRNQSSRFQKLAAIAQPIGWCKIFRAASNVRFAH